MSEQGTQDFRRLVDEYLEGLRSAYCDGGGTEHSGRTALENLLKGCALLWDKDVQIQQEPEQVKGKAPDFKISRRGMVIGYVETKKPGMDCLEVARSEQIKRYKTLNKNILITNYHDFYWSEDERSVSVVRKEDVTQFFQKIKVAKLNDDTVDDFHARLRLFFAVVPDKIASVKELTAMLAIRCHYLRGALKDKFRIQEKYLGERDAVFAIYRAFQVQISREITKDEFADVFAQTLGFSLFLARLGVEDNNITIDLANVKQYIPQSFPLVKELAGYLEKFQEKEYFDIGWLVEEIISIVNNLDSGEIKKDLNFEHLKQRQLKLSEEDILLLERDPFIYFYENFLVSYDKELRKKRGVYYTPAPVVNFIVRAIDDMLKDKFFLHTGLADSSVTALDFACGTGTFLLETMKQIFDNSDKNTKRKVLDEHICEHIYGFEFLMAPYTIAHMKLSQYLKDEGVPLKEGQTLPVYLANTLENFDPVQQESQANLALEKILKEGREAQKIKDKDILVIMGNPPYAVNSMNKQTWIDELVEQYKFINGEPLKERNSKILKDDYVKFIKFSQQKMDNAKEGIVGIITNHSFLDNITFRGMRHSLLQTFDQIYCLDLHGNARKKEKTPSGERDQNIFKIQQGVTISFFVKNRRLEKKVFHADFWGERRVKFQRAIAETYKTIKWSEIVPEPPNYFFFPFDKKFIKFQEKFESIKNIFLVSETAIKTHRDRFAFAFRREDMMQRMKDIIDENVTDFSWQKKYQLKNSEIEYLRRSLKKNGDNLNFDKKLQSCLYRPFDLRYCYYGTETMERPRKIMHHMTRDKNLALISVRQASFSKTWQHVGITDKICECCAISNRGREINYLFPLYLYRPEKDKKIPQSLKLLFGTADPFNGKERIENIHPAFRKEINKKYNEVFSAEQIFFYIYAVLHSSFYRKKYQEFLRIDFPRIPFPDDKQSFLDLAEIGKQLKETHLLEKIPNITIRYEGEGKGENNHKVTKINFSHEKLSINPSQRFVGVKEEIWKFEIGGYQVLNKYLKERKGRNLSLEEIEHIKKIVASLTETSTLMEQIDPIAKKFI